MFLCLESVDNVVLREQSYMKPLENQDMGDHGGADKVELFEQPKARLQPIWSDRWFRTRHRQNVQHAKARLQMMRST